MQVGHSAGRPLPGRISSADSKDFCPVAEQSEQNVSFVLTWTEDVALLQDMLCSGLL